MNKKHLERDLDLAVGGFCRAKNATCVLRDVCALGLGGEHALHTMASDDDGTSTEYHQLGEATALKPLTPPAPPPPQTWWLVPFILLTAAGGHASGHALMPAAPAMEKAGMSAIQYSLLTLVPIAGEVVMPVLWGRFYGRRPRSALCYAPLGLLSGQLAAAAALAVRERAGGDFDARSIVLVISGLSLYLLSKGGLTVMQHAAMALALHAAAYLEPSRAHASIASCTRAAPLTHHTFRHCTAAQAALARGGPLPAGRHDALHRRRRQLQRAAHPQRAWPARRRTRAARAWCARPSWVGAG